MISLLAKLVAGFLKSFIRKILFMVKIEKVNNEIKEIKKEVKDAKEKSDNAYDDFMSDYDKYISGDKDT